MHQEASHTSFNKKIDILNTTIIGITKLVISYIHLIQQNAFYNAYNKKLFILLNKKKLALLHTTRSFMHCIQQKALYSAHDKKLAILFITSS